MSAAKAAMLGKLRKEILALQGRRPGLQEPSAATQLGPMASAFSNGTLPLGAVHEFLAGHPGAAAATYGFMGGLLAPLLQTESVLFWVSASRQVFPPALSYFGITADRVIFVTLCKEQDILWATEEILQSGAAAAVVTEIPQISFIASRRLQLRAEQSGATGFIICHRPRPPYTPTRVRPLAYAAEENSSRPLHSTACATRWRIRPIPGLALDGLPGLGAPSWQVDLLKIRNGRPGSWEIAWMDGRFASVRHSAPMIPMHRQKTGWSRQKTG